MENQIIRTIVAPRILIKKNSKGYGYEIASYSKDDLAEMKVILENIKIIEKLTNIKIKKEGEMIIN